MKNSLEFPKQTKFQRARKERVSLILVSIPGGPFVSLLLSQIRAKKKKDVKNNLGFP